MYLVAIGWMFVVVLMAAAEAMNPIGSVLGAIITLLLYGVLPVTLVMYLLGTPARWQSRRKAEQAELAELRAAAARSVASIAPDGGGHAAGDAVAPVRKEP
jgi:membrane protein implicated in regulation of membrane protease activity